MRRSILLVFFALTLVSSSGCGLLIAGVIYGAQAAHRSSARKDAIRAMKHHNAAAALATRRGDHRAALVHLTQSQRVLNGYLFKYEPKTRPSALAAEYPEIARTARGLVISHLALKNRNQAAAVASQMLPPNEAPRYLAKLHLVDAHPEAVSTAPHMYRGRRASWSGEVVLARHVQSSDTTLLHVVPFTWRRRQVGLRSQRYYDSQLRIYRHRLVPVYRRFKIPLRNKAFLVRHRGYNAQLLPGRVASFVGTLGHGGRGVWLSEATAFKITSKPGGQVIWYLGAQVPTS